MMHRTGGSHLCRRKKIRRFCVTLSMLGLLISQPSCNILGPVAMVGAMAGGVKTKAAYDGLKGQQTGVMVWVERGTRADFPTLRPNLAAIVQEKLKIAQQEITPEELDGTTFPIKTDIIAQYQDAHPEIENEQIADVAARFKLDRLIYIEVTDFSTRAEAQELYRGSISATVRVLEINSAGAKKVFQQDDLKTTFPKDAPKEGLPNATDSRILQGTVEQFSDVVAKLFYKHDSEDN